MDPKLKPNQPLTTRLIGLRAGSPDTAPRFAQLWPPRASPLATLGLSFPIQKRGFKLRESRMAWREQNSLEGGGDGKSLKDFGQKTFPLGGTRLECWRVVAPRGRGQPAALARGEPDGMTSPAARAWNAAVGEGAGCLDHLPSGPPHFPLSPPASPRGPTFRHMPPSPFLPFLSQSGKERRRPSARPLLPQPALPSNSLPPSTRRDQRETTRELGASGAAPAAGDPDLSLGTRATLAGWPPPPPQEPRGCQDLSAPRSPCPRPRPPWARRPAGQLAVTFSPRAPGAGGEGRTRRRRQCVPARSPGEWLGRSAPPWPRAPRAGSGGGGGVWARSLLPPLCSRPRAGRGPQSRAPIRPPRAATAKAGGGARSGSCRLPWAGGTGNVRVPRER